ncbi:hypothetical protein K1719_006843 [Acacia pycnantha]|nr:hypothetical protein K1719_006843 [Acacia pycnantha]
MGSKVEFTPLPQDIEEGKIRLQTQPQCRWWETALRLALIALFVLGVAYRLRQSKTPPPPPIPPTLFLDSLSVPHFNISDGELSASWDANLTISGALNLTIQHLHASIWYEDREPLAWIGARNPEHLGVVPEKKKKMNLKFKTTGWEKDQPIVDDTVIAAMAENRKRGVIRFRLKIWVRGELRTNEWALGFITHPTCPDLEVRFPSPGKKGAAMLTRGDDTSCAGLTEWGQARSLL